MFLWFMAGSDSNELSEKDNLVRLFDSIPSPNVLWRTRDLIYERVTPSYQALFPNRVLVGKPFLEAVPEDEYLPFFAIIRGVFDTGKSVTLKEQLVPFDIDGTGMKDRYYTLSFFQIRDHEGKPYGVYQQAEDNTEQVYARKIIRNSQEELQFALESAKMGTWHVDLKSKTMTTSKSAAAIWGVDEINANVFEINSRFLHPDDLGPTNLALTTAIANRTPFYSEFRILRTNGKLVWVFSKGEPQYDRNGNAVAMMGVLGDITERKNIEAQLTFERHKLRTVVDNSTASIAVLGGENFTYELTNKSYAALFNHRELIGKTLTEALPELVDQPFPAHAKSVFETGVPYIETEAYAKLKRTEDGPLEERYFNQTYSRILDQEGRPYGIFIHAQEVTDLVNARMLLEKALQSRDEFLSVASHELKTPLTSLKIQAQLYQRLVSKNDPRAMDPERVSEIMRVTEKQVTRLNRLVDDMLDVSRIRSEKLDLHPEEFDLGELVQDVIDHLQNQFENVDASQPRIIHKDPARGTWDRFRIEQVVINLLTNALKYGSKKSVDIEIHSGDESVQLIVHDHGIGIDEESKERIFKRFERSINSSEVSGLGLGLFIAQKIVNAHHGTISVESELGKGSRFVVNLPK